MPALPATSETALNSVAWLARIDAFQAFALAAGTVMLVIAVAQWMASYVTDRRALRLFAVRYALGAPGWFFLHPAAMFSGKGVPFASAAAAIALLTLTVCALDEYIGQASRRRLLLTVLAALGGALALWAYLRFDPFSGTAVYVAMAAAMGWCALTAWSASRRERNAGHLSIAIAFATYPALLLLTLLPGSARPSLDLAYLAALPATVVGVTILVASLIRAHHRIEAELRLRLSAEVALRELNGTLEQRVEARTTELQTMIEGLESFTRNVSHDLRGPLAGLTGLAQLSVEVLDEGDVSRSRDLMSAVADQADRLQTMVQDLLTLSRVNSVEFVRSPQALRGLVDAAIEQLKLTPEGARDLERVTLHIEPLPNGLADPDLLRQVFVNLIGNAARFAGSKPDTRGSVRIGAQTRDGEPALYVADDGPGFDASRSGELFKPFRRLHDARLSHNGIGLSIVRRIIERHGGRVWAESTPGAGATFWFTLGR